VQSTGAPVAPAEKFDTVMSDRRGRVRPQAMIGR
jgi:hypothetical protein